MADGLPLLDGPLISLRERLDGLRKQLADIERQKQEAATSAFVVQCRIDEIENFIALLDVAETAKPAERRNIAELVRDVLKTADPEEGIDLDGITAALNPPGQPGLRVAKRSVESALKKIPVSLIADGRYRLR